MLELILDIAGKVIDLFVSDRKRREEWKRRMASALKSEASRSDSSQGRADYDELERRAREGQHDGNRT